LAENTIPKTTTTANDDTLNLMSSLIFFSLEILLFFTIFIDSNSWPQCYIFLEAQPKSIKSLALENNSVKIIFRDKKAIRAWKKANVRSLRPPKAEKWFAKVGLTKCSGC
jgi:hypothetical protein